MLQGLVLALSPAALFWTAVGVLAGMVIGSLPGLTATMGVALLVPFTFGLPPLDGLAMLGALYVCAMFSDSIPAVLVNTPGTPAALTTAFDGHQLALQGKAQHAIVASSFSAMLGAVFGGLAFLFLAGPLGAIGLKFGPPEYFWVGIFAVTIIGSMSGDSLAKGVAGAAIGMLVSTIGLSPTGNVARFTFGNPALIGGISDVAALVGVFAIPQAISMAVDRRTRHVVAEYRPKRGVVGEVVREVLGKPFHLLRSAVIGTIIGILPGAGSVVAALVSYNEAVRWGGPNSKFGKGDIRGVTASEVANNAAAPASMIPLMTLGYPGSAPAAVIAGALLMRGLDPGPSLFSGNTALVYAFAGTMTMSGIITYAFGSVLSPFIARMVSAPIRFLVPIVIFLATIGSFAIRNNMIDVYFTIGIGIFAYIMGKLGFKPGPIGLGLILGPIVEPALVQSIAMSGASSLTHVFFGSTVDIIVASLTALSLIWVFVSRLPRAPQARTAMADSAESDN